MQQAPLYWDSGVSLVDGRAASRAVRLTNLQHFLHKHPQGLTTRELADLCGVSCRTVQRDLLVLETELHVPLYKEGRRHRIIGSYVLPPLTFSLYEAVAIFLAARLALRQTDKDNPHMWQALERIATALPSQLSEQLRRGLRSIKGKVRNLGFIHIFEQVALAWTMRRKLKMRYRSLQSEEAKEWVLEPYYMDMTGVGYSIYVIGHALREGKEGIITFKLDRIEEAEVLEDQYDIPAGFDMAQLLAESWGIIWGEGIEVRLKFSPGVTRRVKESVWHPSQRIEDLPDGGCLLTLRVGSLVEVTPWIRGWGPDVEVLGPEELRKVFKQYAKDLAKIYA